MSRAKSRQNVEVCGDCGALDANWASMNKGILLCTQCCSVHRSLGRHISQVKSVQKSVWHGSQMAMVISLNNNGANNIWEHTLLENSGKMLKKKPGPKDPLASKAEFIKAKHLHCLFALRQHYEDGLLCVENELGKQLHASVRTPNLETSFRLLASGADPNYFHDEKGTTPLHVAVKSEQKLQIEVLLIYGADPTSPDSHGKTPTDYAKQLANKDILHRLIENQYEVTDCFSYYLAQKKPDHQAGIHFLTPENGWSSNPTSLTKLQKLPNEVFEELAIDVFDEIDRRETEAIWLSCADAIDLTAVPFLPVDPTLSSTRNQGRQKLARFSSPELKSLVYDILMDCQRRQLIVDKGRLNLSSKFIDDEPLYDCVASDEDYAAVTPTGSKESSPEKPAENQSNPGVEELTKQLQASGNTINNLKSEVFKLKAYVESLKHENNQLKNRLSQRNPDFSALNGDGGHNSVGALLMDPNYNEKLTVLNDKIMENSLKIDFRNLSKNQRPSSMYEAREVSKGAVPNWQVLKNQLKQDQSRTTTQSLYSSSQEKQSVMQYTEAITKSIQHLCKSLYENIEDCVPNAERVKLSVARLLANLPKEADTSSTMLEFLPRLQPECAEFVLAAKQGDKRLQEQLLLNIREIAYVLAKCTKEIVTKYGGLPN